MFPPGNVFELSKSVTKLDTSQNEAHITRERPAFYSANARTKFLEINQTINKIAHQLEGIEGR